MLIKIYAIKFMTSLGTLLGSVVYNFHKHIKGVKTKKNLKYKEKSNLFQKLDVYYPLDADCIYNKNSMPKKIYPCIIYYHGGAWASYSKTLYTTLCRRLAKMGFVVFNCNYQLAPKVKMCEIESDCRDAFEYVTKVALNFGADANKIVMAGDSAGAHICAELMATFIENKQFDFAKRVKGLGLFYGVYDLETVLNSRFPNVKTYVDACIEGGSENIGELKKYSPIHKNIKEFPPCFMASGEIDKLHVSQSKTMEQSLKENGVKVKTKFFGIDEARAMHAFMNFDGLSTNVETLNAFENFLHDDLNLKGE